MSGTALLIAAAVALGWYGVAGTVHVGKKVVRQASCLVTTMHKCPKVQQAPPK